MFIFGQCLYQGLTCSRSRVNFVQRPRVSCRCMDTQDRKINYNEIKNGIGMVTEDQIEILICPNCYNWHEGQCLSTAIAFMRLRRKIPGNESLVTIIDGTGEALRILFDHHMILMNARILGMIHSYSRRLFNRYMTAWLRLEGSWRSKSFKMRLTSSNSTGFTTVEYTNHSFTPQLALISPVKKPSKNQEV